MTDSHPLLQRLNAAIKPVLSLDYHLPVTESSEGVLDLCQVLEELLSSDLKSVALFRSTNAWDYLENLADCLPAESFLKQIRAAVKTGQGRVRAFIRYSLCESTFPEYLSALAWNKTLTSSYYHDRALLRDEELVSILLLLFVALKPYKFDLPVTAELDRSDYWAFIKPYVPPSREPERRLNHVVSASAPSVVAHSIADAAPPPTAATTAAATQQSDAADASSSSKRKTSARKKKAKVATIGGTAEEVALQGHRELSEQLEKVASQALTYEIDLETERQRRRVLQERIDLLEKELRQHNTTIESLREELAMWQQAKQPAQAASNGRSALSTAAKIGSGQLQQHQHQQHDAAPPLVSDDALAAIDEYLRTGQCPAPASSSQQQDAEQPDAAQHRDTIEKLEQMHADLQDLSASFEPLQASLEHFSQSLRSVALK